MRPSIKWDMTMKPGGSIRPGPGGEVSRLTKVLFDVGLYPSTYLPRARMITLARRPPTVKNLPLPQTKAEPQVQNKLPAAFGSHFLRRDQSDLVPSGQCRSNS